MRSLGNLEKLPNDSILEITRFLAVTDRVNFTLLTCKKMDEATSALIGYETRGVARVFGLEGYFSDKKVFQEMKIFTLVLMRMLELGSLPNANDFSQVFKYINFKFRTLHLPTLTLIALKGKEHLVGSDILIGKVISQPKKYKLVLKHLTIDHYKCSRSQLIKRIKQDCSDLTNRQFEYLLDYNHKSKMAVFLRDGIIFALIITTIVIKILCFYLFVISSDIKIDHFTKWTYLYALIAGITMNLYLNKRYEQYSE